MDKLGTLYSDLVKIWIFLIGYEQWNVLSPRGGGDDKKCHENRTILNNGRVNRLPNIPPDNKHGRNRNMPLSTLHAYSARIEWKFCTFLLSSTIKELWIAVVGSVTPEYGSVLPLVAWLRYVHWLLVSNCLGRFRKARWKGCLPIHASALYCQEAPARRE